MRLVLPLLCVCLALGAPVVSGLAETADLGEVSWVEASDPGEQPAPSETEDSPSAGDAVLSAAHPATVRQVIAGDGWPRALMPDGVDRAIPVPPPVG